jgi:hypothetical protein
MNNSGMDSEDRSVPSARKKGKPGALIAAMQRWRF